MLDVHGEYGRSGPSLNCGNPMSFDFSSIFFILVAIIVRARDAKPVADVFDLTLVLADVGEKAVAQVRQGAVELMTPRLDQSATDERLPPAKMLFLADR